MKVFNVLIDGSLLTATKGSIDLYKHEDLSALKVNKSYKIEGNGSMQDVLNFLSQKFHLNIHRLTAIGTIENNEFRSTIPLEIVTFIQINEGKVNKGHLKLQSPPQSSSKPKKEDKIPLQSSIEPSKKPAKSDNPENTNIYIDRFPGKNSKFEYVAFHNDVEVKRDIGLTSVYEFANDLRKKLNIKGKILLKYKS